MGNTTSYNQEENKTNCVSEDTKQEPEVAPEKVNEEKTDLKETEKQTVTHKQLAQNLTVRFAEIEDLIKEKYPPELGDEESSKSWEETASNDDVSEGSYVSLIEIHTNTNVENNSENSEDHSYDEVNENNNSKKNSEDNSDEESSYDDEESSYDEESSNDDEESSYDEESSNDEEESSYEEESSNDEEESSYEEESSNDEEESSYEEGSSNDEEESSYEEGSSNDEEESSYEEGSSYDEESYVYSYSYSLSEKSDRDSSDSESTEIVSVYDNNYREDHDLRRVSSAPELSNLGLCQETKVGRINSHKMTSKEEQKIVDDFEKEWADIMEQIKDLNARLNDIDVGQTTETEENDDDTFSSSTESELAIPPLPDSSDESSFSDEDTFSSPPTLPPLPPTPPPLPPRRFSPELASGIPSIYADFVPPPPPPPPLPSMHQTAENTIKNPFDFNFNFKPDFFKIESTPIFPDHFNNENETQESDFINSLFANYKTINQDQENNASKNNKNDLFEFLNSSSDNTVIKQSQSIFDIASANTNQSLFSTPFLPPPPPLPPRPINFPPAPTREAPVLRNRAHVFKPSPLKFTSTRQRPILSELPTLPPLPLTPFDLSFDNMYQGNNNKKNNDVIIDIDEITKPTIEPRVPRQTFSERAKILANIMGTTLEESRTELRNQRRDRMKIRAMSRINPLSYKLKKALRSIISPYNEINRNRGFFLRCPLTPNEAQEVIDIALKYRDIIVEEDLLKNL